MKIFRSGQRVRWHCKKEACDTGVHDGTIWMPDSDTRRRFSLGSFPPYASSYECAVKLELTADPEPKGIPYYMVRFDEPKKKNFCVSKSALYVRYAEDLDPIL